MKHGLLIFLLIYSIIFSKGSDFVVREYYKKIDKSFFDGKITIPNKYIDIFIDPEEMQNSRGKKIKIKFKTKKFDGRLCYVHQSKGRLVLQVAYPDDLCKLLKQEFIQTYIAIESEKILNKEKKFRTSLLGGQQEIALINVIDDETIELTPFVKIETQYDNLFKKLVELNVFGWLSTENNSKHFITKNSRWYDISELYKHADTPYVVYYLIDDNNKEIYIGSAKRLGDRVKAGRREIPGWNKFMYEVVHPDFHSNLKEMEYHSIMNFARFLNNKGGFSNSKISNYTLVNRDYKFYRK